LWLSGEKGLFGSEACGKTCLLRELVAPGDFQDSYNPNIEEARSVPLDKLLPLEVTGKVNLYVHDHSGSDAFSDMIPKVRIHHNEARQDFRFFTRPDEPRWKI
jgi:hypothetical protein